MFTGIVEEVGIVEKTGIQPVIRARKILEDIHIGDSICVNGACLTVTEFTNDRFTVDIMPESMRCTNLGELKKGSRVNLERAMPANGRFGGHIVSGHVDGTGIISDIKQDGIAVVYRIKADKAILRYIVNKGSIAIDGISLTVCSIDEKSFGVSIIPHTQRETTLSFKKVGDTVNLETDIIAAYAEKFLNLRSETKESTIDMDFLRKCGF
ncbi:MAG: riboflavin synthase [Firmicutes bacterium]|nr:riboflavin synthase [Bacillota bacterium]